MKGFFLLNMARVSKLWRHAPSQTRGRAIRKQPILFFLLIECQTGDALRELLFSATPL